MKCYLNVTEPALYKSCSDKQDSYFYMYSIPGFDPCHPVSFTEPLDFQFYVNCKFLMPNSNAFDTSTRKLGVDYPNQVQAEEDDLLGFSNRPDDYWQDQDMDYDIKNDKTGLRLSK